ncbi:hypothetical protein LOTGIDRAFT_171339 [Lottia gigantea]|uniref:Uncharacterized protein n=1 Tax=Lottia gigantea TaxID=225164 RepID=V4CMH2_LOTGI|nr:hypothetical protein LOTGIDRAFT_171339 [Lottia gigantea]ESP03545.1 hypothetical protein LOTGIDRAFT_171339 [Lottia gigantea]
MSMIIAQTPKTYFGSDIQKSLGSLPGFPWAKYPGEKHLYIITLVQVQDISLIDANISYHEEYLNHRRPWVILRGKIFTKLCDKYPRCEFKIKDGTPNENRVPQTNTTLENNYFPSLFTEMVLEDGSNPIETIKHPGEFDTMFKKTVLYPKNNDSVSGCIPDVGDGRVLKEPNLPDSQTNNNNIFRVAMNQSQDPIIRKVQVRLKNDNYPNQPLTINPSTKDYNELYRNYKIMCELFGNSPQFEYVDFAINHPIFCFDLSAHQEELFKTGVNINIHIEKTQGDVTGYCLLLKEAKHLIKISDRRMIRIE